MGKIIKISFFVYIRYMYCIFSESHIESPIYFFHLTDIGLEDKVVFITCVYFFMIFMIFSYAMP